MTSDSGRLRDGENSRSEVECAASQSGGKAASPKGQTMTNSCSTKAADAKVELVAKAMAADQAKRHYGIDEGTDEAWRALTDYGRSERLAEARAALEVADTRQDTGGLSGSRASTEPEGGLGPPGFDPGREWQPIETAPKDGTTFLAIAVGADRRPLHAIVQYADRETMFSSVWVDPPPERKEIVGVLGHNYGVEFTDWMRLPEPPASAIEARRAETQGGSVADESAVPERQTPEPSGKAIP